MPERVKPRRVVRNLVVAVVALVLLTTAFSAGAVYQARSSTSQDTLFAALIGAVVGGVLAILGGIAGSFLLNTLEEGRIAEQNQATLVASLLVVYGELSAAQTFLTAALVTLQTFPQPTGLSDASFRSVAAVLAEKLPPDVWKHLQAGYLGVALAVGVLTGVAGTTLDKQAKDSLQLAWRQVKAACDAAQVQLQAYGVVV